MTVFTKMNAELKKITEWLKTNRLFINIDKTTLSYSLQNEVKAISFLN